MKTKIALTTAAALAALLSGCAAQPYNARGAVVPQAMYQPAEASNPYTQTAWALRQWSDARSVPRKLPVVKGYSPLITMVFSQGNGRRQISGVVGCNQYSGDYTVANGVVIPTTDMASTGQACNTRGLARVQAVSLERLEAEFIESMKHIVDTTLDDYSNPRLMTMRLGNGDRLEFVRQSSDYLPRM
ncbi:MAG: META domain-containing protein [Comamonadaceae bacterium]|nr:MAG: META domain-containing protein [Comamonadaceae bacterium]